MAARSASYWTRCVLLLGVSVILVYLARNEVIRYRLRIKNLPGPRGLPIVGSLLHLRNKVHAEQFRQWSTTYGAVFQVQLGNTNVVVINSAKAARQLFVGHSNAMNSRPIFYVLHKQVQSGGPVTSIGTSPWDQSCKNRRKVAATALNRVRTESYSPILNHESLEFLKDILADCNSGATPMDFRIAVRKLAINLVLTLNYGTRVENVKELKSKDSLAGEISYVEGQVSRARNVQKNWANYLPILRHYNTLRSWLGLYSDAHISDIGRRRYGYHEVLLENLRKEVELGIDRPCIQGSVLRDPESNVLTKGELVSVSLSMMAGSDSTQPTLAWGILLLAHRPDIQEKAYDAIVEAGLLEASDVANTKVAYIHALTKEVSRYFTVLKLALPKATYTDVRWESATIPAKTVVFLNSWACNRDEEAFDNPWEFSVERWLSGTQHAHQFAFGIGGRMCVASHLAHNSLYAVFLHLIAHFKILRGDEGESIDPIKGLSEREGFAAIPEGRTARFVPRDEQRLRRVIEAI